MMTAPPFSVVMQRLPSCKQRGRVEFVLRQVLVRLGGEGDGLLAVVQCQQLIARRDQDVAVIVGMKKQLA